MIKCIGFILISAVVSTSSWAIPIGEIRFMAKIVSIDGKDITIDAADKKFHVPRSAFHTDLIRSGSLQEVTLTQDEYYAMNRRFLNDLENQEKSKHKSGR
jgi:hypothetical protein